jgi:hypothetical protein
LDGLEEKEPQVIKGEKASVAHRALREIAAILEQKELKEIWEKKLSLVFLALMEIMVTKV